MYVCPTVLTFNILSIFHHMHHGLHETLLLIASDTTNVQWHFNNMTFKFVGQLDMSLIIKLMSCLLWKWSHWQDNFYLHVASLRSFCQWFKLFKSIHPTNNNYVIGSESKTVVLSLRMVYIHIISDTAWLINFSIVSLFWSAWWTSFTEKLLLPACHLYNIYYIWFTSYYSISLSYNNSTMLSNTGN